nr:uncharacterized protein LOC104087951 [Nicotiana tomentosiformis]
MSEREDNSGLLDYLLEKNEIYDNFQDNAENSSTGFLRTKDSKYGGTNGVMFIQLPKKEVEKNLGRDLSLPAVGGEIALPLFDPVGNNVVEMKLVHTEKDEYHIGGEWEIYAAKYDLLMSDTIFLDKVTVHRDHDQKLNNPSTAKLSYHYEITYQRRRGTKDQSSLAAAAATVLDDAGNNNIKDNGVNSCIML